MRKTKLLAVICVFCAMIITSASLIGTAAYLGDVDGNGYVQSSDARTVLRHAAKLQSISSDKLKIADVTGDGNVNSSDARKILRMASKIDALMEYNEASSNKPSNPTTPTLPSVPQTTRETVVFVPDDNNPGSVDIGNLN